MIIEKIKSKTAAQFKVLECSEKDSTKTLARNKVSEVQKHVSYTEQRLDTTREMKYEVQEMMIGDNVEYAIADEWVNITNEQMERHQEIVDRLKGNLEIYEGRKKQKSERKKMRCKKKGSKEEWKKS